VQAQSIKKEDELNDTFNAAWKLEGVVLYRTIQNATKAYWKVSSRAGRRLSQRLSRACRSLNHGNHMVQHNTWESEKNLSMKKK
jgi:hypothetical protein